MEEVLPIKPIKTPKSEQYNFAIRQPIQTIEDEFETYVLGKLQILKLKALEYAKSKFVVEKAIDDFTKVFTLSDFGFDLSKLTPVLSIGIDYQRERITRGLKRLKLPNVRAQLGINFELQGSEIKYIDLVRQREGYLARVLEDTTFQKMSDVIEKGIREGLSYQEVAANLEQSIGFNSYRAKLIARTEVNWALNEGQRRFMNDIGVKKFRISPARNACEICLGVAEASPGETVGKKIFSISDSGILPIHPNCRCTIISVIPDEWLGEDNS